MFAIDIVGIVNKMVAKSASHLTIFVCAPTMGDYYMIKRQHSFPQLMRSPVQFKYLDPGAPPLASLKGDTGIYCFVLEDTVLSEDIKAFLKTSLTPTANAIGCNVNTLIQALSK